MGKSQNKQNPGNSEQAQPATPALAPATAEPLGAMEEFFEGIPAWVRTVMCLVVVLVIGLCQYFNGRAEPHYPFWDENYHLTSAQRYIARQAHMEPHPPLGLLLIAAGEKLSGVNQTVNKDALLHVKYIDGDKLPPNFKFGGMRLMPSLFSALGALLFFMLMFELTENRLTALLFSSLYLFENAWIVHFRAVHLEGFQMFFCIAAVWLFVRLWKRSEPVPWHQYAWLACLCGLATMVKVNAVVLLALFPILYFRDRGTWLCKDFLAQARHFLLKTLAAVASLCVTVFMIFTVHALVGNQPGNPNDEATQNDLRFMSSEYKDYVNLHKPLTPMTVIAIAHDYYLYMDNDHKGVPKLDVCKEGENGSHPLHWPIHDKTINYRWDSNNGKTSYVQLVGNEFSWYLGLVAVLFSLLAVANRRLFGVWVGEKSTYALIEVFTALYVIIMLLHLYLGAQRVMYLYHYFLGLFISYILIVLNWRYLCELHEFNRKIRTAIAAGLAVCILGSCLFFLPLSNHWPLTKQQCERRNIFSVVVDCQG